MKKLIMLFLLSSVAASAQVSVPCAPTSLFRITDATFYDVIPTITAEALIKTPAKFPNPASEKEIDKSFTMKCPQFTATSKKGLFILEGNIQSNFNRLISYWKNHDPDTSDYFPGRIDLGFYGDFYYESIREGWFQERLMLSIVKGKLFLDYADHNEYLEDLVVGYRVNGTSLKPAFFNMKTTQLKYGPKDIVEIYVKGEHAQFSYMRLDFKKQVITIKHGTAFPAK